MKDDRLYLIHIRECIERIEQYTLGGKDAFFADTKSQDAVLRVLRTLAESTQRISDGLKASHPGAPGRRRPPCLPRHRQARLLLALRRHRLQVATQVSGPNQRPGPFPLA